MKLEKLSHDERVEYLLLPILKALQSAGGQLTRTEIQEKICAEDDDIAEFASKVKNLRRLVMNIKNLHSSSTLQ